MAKKSVRKAVPKISASSSGKGMPLGVKVISVLNYVNATLLIIAGAFLLWYAFSGQQADVAGLTQGSVIISAVVFILLSVLSFFIARGLWKGQNWARVTEAIFGIVAIISGIMNVFQNADIITNIIGIVLNGIIVGYLLFNSSVKKAFSN